jgi:DNA-binding response OmpR family regulator
MAKILLAEDDDSLRGFLVNALKRAGHAVKDFDEGRSSISCSPTSSCQASMASSWPGAGRNSIRP